MVSIENSRGVAFAFANGAIVVQQLAQFFNRIAYVSTQHVFTIKLVVHLPNRAFKKATPPE